MIFNKLHFSLLVGFLLTAVLTSLSVEAAPEGTNAVITHDVLASHLLQGEI